MRRAVAFLLVLLVAVPSIAGLSADGTADEIVSSTEDFIARLEAEYKDISNFTAQLSLSGLEPPVSVRVVAITDRRCLRVEYLSPDRMRGQFFLLEDDFLHQYMPGRNLIIRKELDGADLPVEAANLTPDYLLRLVRSDDLKVNLIGTPVRLYRPGEGGSLLRLEESLSGRSLGGDDSVGSDLASRYGSVFDFGTVFGEYVLEVIPESDDYRFSRQVIQFDPDDLLPRELITYFEDRETVYTTVEEVKTNRDLEVEEVTRLPEDAEIIED